MIILAIDDNRDNLTALQAVVSDRLPEATVLTALNGPDGLDLARAEDPDVILLDIVMSGVDGYEVCRRLKADPVLQAIPVLFLTANRTDRASRVKALEAGAEGFLSKPFDDLELTAQIQSMVKIKAAAARQRTENERLAALIAERTRALESELEQRRQAEEELRDGSRRAALQRSAIAHLTSDRQIADGDLDSSLETIAEAMSATVGVARASIWQLSDDELELRCLTLYEADQQTYSSGAILETDVFPHYFEAIMAEGRIYAEDAQSDPRTNELTESYLRPLGIASVLDAGILVKGKLVGVVCLEHIGRRRAWYADEESFVSTMAALVGQLLVNAERKRAETALQVSEARYRALVENIPQKIFVKDRAFRWVSANENFLQDLGLSLEEIVGKEDYDLFPEELADKYRADDRRIMETGATEEMEEQYPHDGRMTWVHTVKTPVRGQDGEITGVFGIFWGVTERREAGIALRASEERLTDITSSMGDWVWETDENGAYTYSSQKSLDLLGVPPEDVIGKTPFDFMPPDEAERVAALFSEIAARKAPITDLENWNLRADGKGVCLLTNAFPILDGAGNLKGYRGVDRDITRRKEDGRLRRLSSIVLGILNEPIPFTETVQRTFAAIKRTTGLDAVGMRLQEGDDFPYFSQDGLSAEFVQAENALAERDASGDVCRDAHGNICLACTCGLVISGKADLTNPLFTSGGSFCANDSSLLLQLPPDQDPRRNPRNRCFHDGYASVALIPIRANQEIVGLLHLSDRRKGRFSRRLIQAFEGICTSIGIALMRKRAEEELRASEQSYRNQFAMNSSVMLLVAPVDGAILDANAAALAFYGYSQDQLLAMKITDINSLPVPEVQQAMASVPQDRGGHFQFQHRLADGSMRDVSVSTSRIRIGERAVLHSIISDITERKRAEETIRRNEARLRGMVNILQYHAETAQEFLHNALDEAIKLTESTIGYIFSYSEERKQLVLDTYSKEVSKECEIEVPQKVYELGKTGIWGEAVRQRKPFVLNDFDSPHPLRRGYPEGHVHLDRFMTVPVFREDQIVAVVGVANKPSDYDESDILQLSLLMDSIWRSVAIKEGEEALRDSEERFQQLFDHMADGVAVYEGVDDGEDFVFVDMNGTGQTFSKVRLVDVVGRRVTEVFPSVTEIGLLDVLRRVWRSGQPEHHPLKDYVDDRIELWVENYVYKLPSGLIVAIFSDTTAQKQAEAEADKLQTQLQQAQKMESVGRLAGGVAHDFNNMLEVIIGHTEFAIEDTDPALPMYADLQEVVKAARRSADLTRQLLAFARKEIVAPEILDLNETVEGMLKMLRRLIGEDVDIDWRPKADLWPVMMDPSQVDQILANLCVNGRDAIAGVGRIIIKTGNCTLDEVYCSAHVDVVPGEFAQLTISDNGCGMDQETAAHIFEPFFTTKAMDKGTGLGLATVYGIVKQNNGCIDTYSKPGLGTTFKIHLPRHKGDAGESVTEAAAPPMRGYETILLVEDEASILRMAKKMLENQGYTVLAANTPGEATRLLTQHTGEIHLLMTDVIMPEMNGKDLMKSLLPHHPGLKCLFMSGYTADVIAHHGVLDEGVFFIPKPFSIRELSAKVREALGSE